MRKKKDPPKQVVPNDPLLPLEIDIILPYEDGFERIRRKKRSEWEFLVQGEWSQSPMHQGRCYFYTAHTPDKRYWAVLNRSWPRCIVAVAHVPGDHPVEDIAAEMLRRVRKEGGEYIGSLDDYSRYYSGIDITRFWNRYRRPDDKEPVAEKPGSPVEPIVGKADEDLRKETRSMEKPSAKETPENETFEQYRSRMNKERGIEEVELPKGWAMAIIPNPPRSGGEPE